VRNPGGRLPRGSRRLRDALGEKGIAELAQCYSEADSCAEAKGCEAALAIEGAAATTGEFFESFGDKLRDKEKAD
jgi:hypothetical protein